MTLRNAALAGLMVVAAGVYELTPLKRACLQRCRALDDCLAGGQTARARHTARQGLRYAAHIARGDPQDGGGDRPVRLDAGRAQGPVPLRAITGDLWPTDLNRIRMVKPDFDATLLKHVGHYPTLERPAEFNEAVRRVVDELTSRGGGTMASLPGVARDFTVGD